MKVSNSYSQLSRRTATTTTAVRRRTVVQCACAVAILSSGVTTEAFLNSHTSRPPHATRSNILLGAASSSDDSSRRGLGPKEEQGLLEELDSKFFNERQSNIRRLEAVFDSVTPESVDLKKPAEDHKNEAGETEQQSGALDTSMEWGRTSRATESQDTYIENFPLVQVSPFIPSIELPGFQSVWKIPTDDESYTMFLELTRRPQPWKFGQLTENPSWDTIGSLLQVTDFEVDSKDGSLKLLVQGLDRFRIVDQESVQDYFGIATLAKVKMVRDMELTLTTVSHGSSSRSFVDANHRTTSLTTYLEDLDWSEFESKPAALSDIQEDENSSPLTEYNLAQVPDELQLGASEIAKHGSLLQEKYQAHEVNLVTDMEYKLWVALDSLLGTFFMTVADTNDNRLEPTKILPSALLSLLPSTLPTGIASWPEEFALNEIFENWSSSNDLTQVSDCYSDPLRRAKRLSYTIWKVLDTVSEISEIPTSTGVNGVPWLQIEGRNVYTRQNILESTSITTRLSMAFYQIETIHQALLEKSSYW